MIAERLLLALLVGGIAAGCVLVLHPFFSALLWAAILVFTTWPLAEWLRVRLRLGRVGTAATMVMLTAIVVLLPLAAAAPAGTAEVDHLHAAIDNARRAGLPSAPHWVFQIPVIGPSVAGILDRWAADITALGESLKPYFGIVLEGALSVLLGIAQGVLMFGLALFVAFFFYLYGETLSVRLRLILYRIAGARADRLIVVTGATVRGVVYGILGTAIVQGMLTALGLWIAGVPRPVLLGAAAGFLAVLPIGAPLVWIPAALWLAFTGHLGHGIFLGAYGGLAITGADHLIRPWFIARGAQLPFLLTVLGVLGGVLAFGLLGIFLGPVLLGVGFTLVNEWAYGEPRPFPEER